MVTVETCWETSPYTKEAFYIIVLALKCHVSTPLISLMLNFCEFPLSDNLLPCHSSHHVPLWSEGACCHTWQQAHAGQVGSRERAGGCSHIVYWMQPQADHTIPAECWYILFLPEDISSPTGSTPSSGCRQGNKVKVQL